MRTPRYQQIADALRTRILAGEFAAGRLLPSESGLGSRYDASRVTIRRALEQLRDEGLLASRQGLGWYASGDEVHQSLDELETLEHQLTSSGVEAARRVLDFSFGVAPAPARAALGTYVFWWQITILIAGIGNLSKRPGAKSRSSVSCCLTRSYQLTPLLHRS